MPTRIVRAIPLCLRPVVGDGQRPEVAAAAAALFHEADLADDHRLVDRLDHVVDGQRGDRHGVERFHLDAGLRRRPHARFDLVAVARGVSSTSAARAAADGTAGSRRVCFAAMMPASRAVCSGSPFFTAPFGSAARPRATW